MICFLFFGELPEISELMPLIAAVIKIWTETVCFQVCFGSEKDFSAVFIYGICGAEAETFGKAPQFRMMRGAGNFPRNIGKYDAEKNMFVGFVCFSCFVCLSVDE